MDPREDEAVAHIVGKMVMSWWFGLYGFGMRIVLDRGIGPITS